MMKLFEDDLPLDGEVLVEDCDGTYIYLGYHVQDYDMCAVRSPAGESTWVWRNRISVKKEE